MSEPAVRITGATPPVGVRPYTGQPDTPPPPVPATHYRAELGNSGGAGPGQVGCGGPGPGAMPMLGDNRDA